MVKKKITLLIRMNVSGENKEINGFKQDLRERELEDMMWNIGEQNNVEVDDTKVIIK